MTSPATPAALVAAVEAAGTSGIEPETGIAWHSWGEGEPLVLAHGSFGAWTHWIRNVEALSQRFRVIAIDLPGLGDSAEPPEPFTIESLGAHVAAGVSALLRKDERLHLCGFSFGGIVLGQTALVLGDRVASYTALGSNALGLPMDKRGEMAKPNRGMSPDEIAGVHRHNLGVIMFGDPDRIDDLALHLQMENTRRARIRSGTIPRGDSLARAIAAMRCPVLGVWGERDATAGRYLDDRRRLFEALPHCIGFHLVPGAGHWAAFETPEAVNRILLDELPRL